MPLLGQASGGWTESSSALRVLNLGIANSVGVLTDDAFTQTNPPIVTGATTVTAQVDQTLSGVLSGSVCFARGDAAGGSNFIGGPASISAGNRLVCRPIGVFLNSANGNAFENTPGVASGKNPYASGMGTFGNTLFEDKVLTGGNTDHTETITEKELMKLERASFLELAKNPATLARMEVMLDTGKPLRN